MSRTIGFRAWSNEHNRYCDFITLDENSRCIGWIKSSGVYLTTTDIVLEQDTGLKDKNGKKIYENDIIKDTSDGDCLINAVFWCEKGGFWSVKPRSPFAEREWGWFIGRDSIEVIGNVHENKELLGGEE